MLKRLNVSQLHGYSITGQISGRLLVTKMIFRHQLWYSWVINPLLRKPALALVNVVTVFKQADDEVTRDGCEHTLSVYKIPVTYHINHKDRNKAGPKTFNSYPATKWLTACKQFTQSMPHESLEHYLSVTTRIIILKSQHTWGSPLLLLQDAPVHLAIPLQKPSDVHAPEPAIFLHQNDGQMDPSWHAMFLRRGLDLEE